MKDIDNISYINSKILNNTNSNNIKRKKENIIVKKIFKSNENQIKINKKNNTSNFPKTNSNNNINNNKKINILKKNESNFSEIISLEKKYNKLLNNKLNEKNNNKIISQNIIKGNFISLKNESEITKPNTLNTKIEKKEDELEGPELIHFSLVDLIQKANKKMEEIGNLNNYKK